MSKRRNQSRNKTAEVSKFDLHNVKSSLYHGAARFLEIAPPGIQFRSMTNVDHITSITFGNHIEEIKHEGVPIEEKHTGYDIIVGIAGQQNAFTFHRLEVAIAYYNDLLDMLAALGVPCAMKPRIQFTPPPAEPEEVDDLDGGYKIVGADGEPINDDDDDDDPLIDELDELLDDDLEMIPPEPEPPTEH